MTGKIAWKTILLYTGVIALGLLVGPLMRDVAERTWDALSQPGAAQAAEETPAAIIAPDSPDAVYICTPLYVGAFGNRIHVRCSASAPGGIYYFASPTSDSKNAARLLSIMLTAKSLGKNLQIYYSAGGDGSAYGCLTSDCRPITALEIMN
jgi:hypothetical protein